MNEEVILQNLKEKFTLKNLIKSYVNQKEKTLPNKIVVRVIKTDTPVIILNKQYLRFILSDEVNTISILLLESKLSLKQKKILNDSLKYNEPVIISKLRKLKTLNLEISQGIEVSQEILPIGTIIEPLNTYDPQAIHEYFFKSNDKKKQPSTTVNKQDSPFVTASDLFAKEELTPIAALNDLIFASQEELIDYLRENKKNWVICFSLDIKNFQKIKFRQISYIIEIPKKKNKDFTSKLKFIGLEEKKSEWIRIFEIEIRKKDFYETIKKNLDAFSSIETLTTLLNIGE